MTEDERDELRSILDDLRGEEAAQQQERGHASSLVMRAAVRLERLLEGQSPGVLG